LGDEVAAEVGGRALLAGGDDAAPDLARSREELEQLVRLAPAYRPRQRLQIFSKPAEYLQNSFAVRDEDISPHRGV